MFAITRLTPDSLWLVVDASLLHNTRPLESARHDRNSYRIAPSVGTSILSRQARTRLLHEGQRSSHCLMRNSSNYLLRAVRHVLSFEVPPISILPTHSWYEHHSSRSKCISKMNLTFTIICNTNTIDQMGSGERLTRSLFAFELFLTPRHRPSVHTDRIYDALIHRNIPLYTSISGCSRRSLVRTYALRRRL